MKKRDDPRHKIRAEIMKSLFAVSFQEKIKLDSKSTTAKIIKKQKEIDKLIANYAPAWPIEQIAPIDLAILRLAIWELRRKKNKEPYKVIIDEAVELGKEYGSIQSASFINGVLGSIVAKSVKKQ